MGATSEKMIQDAEEAWEDAHRRELPWIEIVDLCEKTLSEAGLNPEEIVRKVRLLQEVAEQFWEHLPKFDPDGRKYSLPSEPNDSRSFELLIADHLAAAIRLTVSEEALKVCWDAEDELYGEGLIAHYEAGEAMEREELKKQLAELRDQYEKLDDEIHGLDSRLTRIANQQSSEQFIWDRIADRRREISDDRDTVRVRIAKIESAMRELGCI